MVPAFVGSDNLFLGSVEYSVQQYGCVGISCDVTPVERVDNVTHGWTCVNAAGVGGGGICAVKYVGRVAPQDSVL